MEDITDRKDIILLVDEFYEQVKADQLLGPVFSHLDWPKHMPTMYNFWSSMMFGDMSYQGNPFQKHLNLKIGPGHFKRWLELFIGTVDAHFLGPKATEIKDRAHSIASVFQHKLGLY
jgi:hemoglobin